ncbi:heme exporter protein CcmB [Fluviispira multicolorata]|uniref:heme exporter protein CcmB n=1 Tax=Fluviispira multicolorata TaxID=2654512 RepID=UPI0013757FA4|nr:heme exporter protein CcmB [Fluviispira multicolorata]
MRKYPSFFTYFIFINKISCRSIWMRKASWFGTLLFAGCLLILFPFGLGTEALQRNDVRIGSLWIINEFIAALIIGRMFSPEQESFALDYILSSRMPRAALLVGKISFTALQILSLQIPVTFFWIILYNVQTEILIELLKTIVPISLIFNLGTASLGALVSCLTARSLAKEILQPMLFFPLQSGVLLAAVSLSMQIGDNVLLGAFSSTAWWTVLSAYPILFTAMGFLLSNVLLQE